MANRSESTFQDVNRIWKLKEEKSELRSHLCSLKEQYVLAVQGRDSLKLGLQLISKDLYFQLKKNEDKDKPCALPMKVQKVSDSCANSSQRPLSTKRSKSQTLMPTKNNESNSIKNGSEETANDERLLKPVTVIAGDSIMQRLPGWKLPKTMF